MDEVRADGYSPTIRKRSLSRKLVELRKACGLTTTEVQQQLGWSATKLNYIEKAKWIEPSSDAVADLCELYGVEGRQREALIQLAREGRQRGWWRKYNDVFSNELPGFEAGASHIATFETAFIPGLLQIPAYIELITRAAGIDDPAAIKRHVAARTERQEILTRASGPCQLHAIIDQNAIARITDPAIRRAQLTHLTDITSRPNIDVQILPFTAGVYPGTGEVFTCLSFPDPSERDFIYLESAIDDRMLEEPDEVHRYKLKFQALQTAALTPKDTRTHLKQQIA